jgi:ABC-type bacteriocin/lantibiotic exporter with double-glycine peptidase domain
MPNVYIKKPHYKQEKDFSCIPACLKMILEFFNKPVAESDLRKQLKTKPFGTHIINVVSLKEFYGIEAKIEFWSLEELKTHLNSSRIPCIALVWTEYFAHWKQNCLHSVIVIGYSNEHVIINDPIFDEKEFLVPFDDFINAWQANDGLVVIFKK